MGQKKRLLFINPHQFGHTAGYYYYCQYLESEFDITYIGFDEGLEKLAITGIRVIYVPQKKNKLIRILTFIYKTIYESYNSKYDIMYVYSFYFSFIIGLFSRHTKKIIDIRTDSISVNPRKRYLLNKLIKFNTLFFSKAIVLSNDLIDLLKLSRSKSHLLPLGSQKYFDGSHAFDELKLLYVGALNTRNITQTVEGLYLFLKRNRYNSNISYKIVGFGNIYEEESLKESIYKYRLKGYVNFEGRKNYEELPFYFKNCNIGISWIPITPAFNLQPAAKTFEYIMSGLFCIATSTKANRDVINNKNGILLNDTPGDFADALEEVYKNKDKFSSNKIRETVEGYSWQNLVYNNLMPFLKCL